MTDRKPEACANCGFERRHHEPLGLCPDQPRWPDMPPRKFRARETEEARA